MVVVVVVVVVGCDRRKPGICAGNNHNNNEVVFSSHLFSQASKDILTMVEPSLMQLRAISDSCCVEEGEMDGSEMEGGIGVDGREHGRDG